MRHAIIRLALCMLITLALSPVARAAWQLNGIPVGAPTNTQSVAKLVPNGAGGVAIFWSEEVSGDPFVFGTVLNSMGDTMFNGPPIVVFTVLLPQTQTVVPDGVGGEIAVWNVLDGGSWDIVAQRIDGHGNLLWGVNGVTVTAAANDQLEPYLIADGAGGAICGWNDFRSHPFRDIYAQRMDASGNMLWTTNGVGVSTLANGQYLGALVSDNAGGAALVWSDARNGVEDLYVQRLDGSGSALWGTNGTPFVVSPIQKVFTSMVPSGPDGAIIGWVQPRPGPPQPTTQWEGHLLRLNFSSSPDWPGSVPICIADGSQTPTAAVTDGAGGVIVAFHDDRNGSNTDEYLARIDRFGNRVWNQSGVPLCTAGGDQLESVMTPDGAGGAIVAWTDHRGGPAADIYAGRIDALGNLLWTPNGVPVCTDASNQSAPAIASDGVGGVVVAWEDSRFGHGSIFAQRLKAANGEWGPPDATGIGDAPSIGALTILPNYPNPFAATTNIEIRVPSASDVSVDVFDVAGRRVSTLAMRGADAGWDRIPFAGLSADGRPLPSGVYFYRVTAGGHTATRKMVIAR